MSISVNGSITHLLLFFFLLTLSQAPAPSSSARTGRRTEEKLLLSTTATTVETTTTTTDSANDYTVDSLMRECSSNKDCASSYCCTVGMMRYTIPTCIPMGQLGDSCIPHNSPTNFTLTYPNGETRTAEESYRILCPCSWSLTCDPESGTCVRAASRFGRKPLKRKKTVEEAAAVVEEGRKEKAL